MRAESLLDIYNIMSTTEQDRFAKLLAKHVNPKPTKAVVDPDMEYIKKVLPRYRYKVPAVAKSTARKKPSSNTQDS